MKYLGIVAVFFLIIVKSNIAQNLVPNPSFEDTIQSNGQPIVKNWRTNIGTPDYFSDHFKPPFENNRANSNIRGYESPYEGAAIFAINVLDRRKASSREYLQIELKDSLRKDELYEIEFYLSLADSFHLALDEKDIGIHLSDTLYPNNFDHSVREFIPYFTSDTSWNAKNKIGWERFHHTYKASGGEKVITIGCFKKDDQIMVDSVGNGGSFSFSFVGSFYFIDMIRVEMIDTANRLLENQLRNQIKAFPNPFEHRFKISLKENTTINFQWFNFNGQQVLVPFDQNTSELIFNTEKLSSGIYLLQLSDGKYETAIKLIKH